MSDGVSERDEGSTFGGFVLRRQLGSDVWGDRWAVARVDGDGTEYAMLVARPGDGEARDRLLEGLSEVRSAYAGTTLRHTNILTLEEAGVIDDVPFLVYEAFPGCGLDSLIDAWHERGEVDDDHDQRIAELFVEIGAAVQHAHEFGIAHGDLRPSNLLIDGDRVRVHGYGLCAVADDVRSLRSARLSVTAPEIVDDPDRPIDELADLYSLGVLMYQALTLNVPYEGINREALRRAILRGDAPAPAHVQPWIPKDLSCVVVQAMSRRREERYPSLEAFVADLYRFIDGEPVHARGPSAVEEAVVWARANPNVCKGVAAGLLAVALGGALFTGGDDEPAASAAEDVALVEPEEEPYTEEMPPIDGIEEGVSLISPGLEFAPAPAPIEEDEPETVEALESAEPLEAVIEDDGAAASTDTPLVTAPVIETQPWIVDSAPVVLEPEPVVADASEDVARDDDQDAPDDEIAEVVESVEVLEPAPWSDEIVDPEAFDEPSVAEAEVAPQTGELDDASLDDDTASDPDAVADVDEVALPDDTLIDDALDASPTTDDVASAEDDLWDDDIWGDAFENEPVAPIETPPLDDVVVASETDEAFDAFGDVDATPDPFIDDVASADPVVEDPVVEAAPEPPPRPLTRAEWTDMLVTSAAALRRAHTDVDAFAGDVVVETIFTPQRDVAPDLLWDVLDDATIAQRMPQLASTAREAIDRLAKGLTVASRSSRVAHPDWEAAFEAFVVVGAIPPSPITIADLPPVEITAPWLEARTALAVLDGAYVPDMWIVPDLYLRTGRIDDAEVLCEHLLAAGLPEDGEAFAQARLTWAAARLAPGASTGGASEAWSIVHDALASNDPSLVARASHLLGERALRRGDVSTARDMFVEVEHNAGTSATLWSWAAEADRWVRSLTPPPTDAAALELDDPFDDATERLLRALAWHDRGCDEAARTVFERIAREGFASDEAARAAERLRCASLLAVQRPLDARFAVDELTDYGAAVLSPDVVFVMARAAVALHRGGHDAYDLLTSVHDRVVQWYGDASDDARFIQALLDGADPFAPTTSTPFMADVADPSPEPTATPSVFDVFASNVEPVAAAKARDAEPEPDVDPMSDLPPELRPDPHFVPPESDLRYPFRNADG